MMADDDTLTVDSQGDEEPGLLAAGSKEGDEGASAQRNVTGDGATDGGDSEGQHGESLGSSGNKGVESEGGGDGVEGAAEDSAEEQQEVFEGVTAEDFADYSQMMEVRLDALVASSVVLVVVLFVCVGILAVDTLVRSLEKV